MGLLGKSGAVHSLNFGFALERLAPLICRQATNKLDVDGNPTHRGLFAVLRIYNKAVALTAIRGILSEI